MQTMSKNWNYILVCMCTQKKKTYHTQILKKEGSLNLLTTGFWYHFIFCVLKQQFFPWNCPIFKKNSGEPPSFSRIIIDQEIWTKIANFSVKFWFSNERLTRLVYCLKYYMCFPVKLKIKAAIEIEIGKRSHFQFSKGRKIWGPMMSKLFPLIFFIQNIPDITHDALKLEKSAISKVHKSIICIFKNDKKSHFAPEKRLKLPKM